MHYIDYHKEKSRLKINQKSSSKYIDYYKEKNSLPTPLPTKSYLTPPNEEKIVFIDSNKIPVVVLVPTEKSLLTKTLERDKLNKQQIIVVEMASEEAIATTETNSDLTV